MQPDGGAGACVRAAPVPRSPVAPSSASAAVEAGVGAGRGVGVGVGAKGLQL